LKATRRYQGSRGFKVPAFVVSRSFGVTSRTFPPNASAGLVGDLEWHGRTASKATDINRNSGRGRVLCRLEVQLTLNQHFDLVVCHHCSPARRKAPDVLRLEYDEDMLLMHDEQTRVFVVALTRITRSRRVVWSYGHQSLCSAAYIASMLLWL